MLARGLIVSLLLTVGVLEAPIALADELYPITEPSFTLIGSGFGHHRGLSQYGAYRAGTLGIDSTTITDAYYSGTTMGTVGNSQLRVRLEATVGDRLVMFPTSPGLTFRDESSSAEAAASSVPAATLWRVVADSVESPPGTVNPGLRVQYQSGASWISLTIGDDGKTLFPGSVRVFDNSTSTIAQVDEDNPTQRTYRGNHRIERLSPSTVAAVNIVPLESYLRSVVPSESPASWPSPSLEAQAIAARSYSAWHIPNPKASYYNICDTTTCQVYSGTSTEHPRTDTAVTATAGKVRMLGGGAVRTEFSSSNGGWAAAGSPGHRPAGYDAWTDGPWDPSHLWTRTISATTLGSLVGPGVSLTSLRVTERDGIGDWGGRVIAATLTGKTAQGATVTEDVSGDDIRRHLGLRSTLFTVSSDPAARWHFASELDADQPWTSSHTYGAAANVHLVGDWDGDGVATPAIVVPVGGEWRWRMGAFNDVGAPEFDFMYGPTSCTPISGDWDGDGRDTPGITCELSGSLRWRLSNVNAVSAPAADFLYGPVGAPIVVGDWDGLNGDGIGIVQTANGQLIWKVRNTPSAGPAQIAFAYGGAGDLPLTGDWDGNGTSGVAALRVVDDRWIWKLRETASGGSPTLTMRNGLGDMEPLVSEAAGGAARPVLID